MHLLHPVRRLLPVAFLASATLHVGCGGDSTPEPGPVEEQLPREDPPLNPDSAPGPRRAVNGLAGFQSRSTIEFIAQAGEVQQLVATYVFPDRARWRLDPVKAPDERNARYMLFRWGEELWELPSRSDVSIPFLGEQKRLATLPIELRRVAMTWPAELEWKDDGEGSARAELPGLGILIAEMDPKTERPTAIESWLTAETPDERLEEIEWRTIDRRICPASWTLRKGGKPIWRETFDEFLAGGRFLDSYFQPSDRQGLSGVTPEVRPQEADLPPRFVLARPLEPRASWDQAFAAFERELAVWKKKLEPTGLRLDESPVFLLSQRGRPVTVELRVVNPLGELPEGWKPEGWKHVEAGKGLTLRLDGLAGLEWNALPTLRALVPGGRRPGTPYARVEREEGHVRGVQVVLPLVSGG